MKFIHAVGLISLCCIAQLSAEKAPLSVQEAFHIKKISELWKDGDYEASKKQISFFIETYPQSSASDSLYAMLGDLYFHEDRYEEALTAYEQIQDGEINAVSLVNQIQCLFELKDYHSVVDLASSYFKLEERNSEEESKVHFFIAESYFIRATKGKQEENRSNFLSEALPHYMALAKTKYETLSLFPLAEIYKEQGKDAKAAAIYQVLAQKYPHKKEKLLFQAGLLELKFDHIKAIETFGAVAELKGKKAKTAIFNKLSLLYQEKRYNDLILTAQTAAAFLTKEEMQEFDFYLGKSYHAQGDIQKAMAYLNPWIAKQTTASNRLKSAYASLIQCAKESKNDVLFKQSYESFTSFFPETEQKELFLSDYVILLSQNKKWKEARETALSFLALFPSHEQAPQLIRHVLYCSKQDLKLDQWIGDLKLALSRELSPAEKNNFQHLLIKALLESQDYTLALQEIEVALQQAADDAELHLAAAICHKKLLLPATSFIYHAEKALSLNKELHLQLYNAYLASYQENNQPGDLEQAANHLWEYQLAKPGALKQEHTLWLANHSYQKFCKGDAASSQRAIALFEGLINAETLSIKEASIHLENEALKLVDLYAKTNHSAKKTALLEALNRNYEAEPALSWKCKKRVLFELAQSYESLLEKEKALKTYDQLLHTSPHTSSYLADASLLQKVRLQYGFMHERQETNPQIAQILNDLKNLQIKRSLASEPIHLEAALEYVEIKRDLSSASTKQETSLFFLKRLKEDFLGEEDSISKDYHAARAQSKEKEGLFQAYMKYVDAQILLAEAASSPGKASELKAKALLKMDELLQTKDNLHPALVKRLQSQRGAKDL
jgi:tetratricopeptide (TPR) repeat protein